MEKKKTDRFAIASFVLSLLNLLFLLVYPFLLFYSFVFSSLSDLAILFWLPVVISTVVNCIALTCGIAGLIRIKRNNSLKGGGFAWTGIIISVIFLITALILLG